MNFKVLLFVSILFCISVTAYSQTNTIETEAAVIQIGDSEMREPGTTMGSVLSVRDNQLILEMSGGNDQTLYATYDESLKVVDLKKGLNEEVAQLFNYENSDPSPTRFDFADRQFCLKGITDSDKQLNRVLLYEIDMFEQEVLSEEEIGSIQGEGYYKNFKYSALSYDISPDGSKLVIMYKLPEVKDSKGRIVYNFQFTVYDNNLKKIWEREVAFQDPESQISVGGVSWLYGGSTSAFSLSDNGNIMCWATNKSEEFTLYNIDADETVKAKVPDVKKGKWSFITHNSSMVMVGTYTKEEKGAAGLLLVSWDGNENSTPIVGSLPFELEHLVKNQTEKNVSKLKKKASKGKPLELSYFHILSLKILEDRSLVVVGQRGAGSEYLGYHIFNISAENGLRYSAQIPYYGYSDGFHMGTEFKYLGNTMYMFFNDRVENFTADWSVKTPEKYWGSASAVALVKLDFSEPDENPKRYRLWSPEDVQGKFEPRKFISPKGSTFAYAYIQGGRGTQRLLRIDLK